MWKSGWQRNVPDVTFWTMSMRGVGGSWQLAQVHFLHSHGLIPVRVTATHCPSGELKIESQAKNTGELYMLSKAALTWTKYIQLSCTVINLNLSFLFFLTQDSVCKMTRPHTGNYNMSSSMTLFCYCQELSEAEQHQKFPWACVFLMIKMTLRARFDFSMAPHFCVGEMTVSLSAICGHGCLRPFLSLKVLHSCFSLFASNRFSRNRQLHSVRSADSRKMSILPECCHNSGL